MSNFSFKAKNKITGELVHGEAIDDYFGKHSYGYSVGEKIYNQLEFNESFEYREASIGWPPYKEAKPEDWSETLKGMEDTKSTGIVKCHCGEPENHIYQRSPEVCPVVQFGCECESCIPPKESKSEVEEGIENCTCGEYKEGECGHRYNGHPCVVEGCKGYPKNHTHFPSQDTGMEDTSWRRKLHNLWQSSRGEEDRFQQLTSFIVEQKELSYRAAVEECIKVVRELNLVEYPHAQIVGTLQAKLRK